jgi:uncharacterized protein
MNCDRLFLDTAFIQALLNPRDDYHTVAKALFPRVRNAQEAWITEAILTEVGNALSASNRNAAIKFINQCYQTDNIRVVSINPLLFRQSLDLYSSRPDKNWGLTDCISFVVMTTNGITEAVTSDRHFVQAGFRSIMLE